jgi:hypothetical protein
MNRGWKVLTLATALGAAGLGVFVTSSVGDDGTNEVAGSISGSYGSIETISGEELRPAGPLKLGLANARPSKRSSPKPKLFYYIAVDTLTVNPNEASLFEIRCPRKQQPATGGVFASVPGLAVTNSSRMNPVVGLPTVARAWYEGVVNFTNAPLQWRPFLTCLGK